MQISINGGGSGKTANSGSAINIASYLEHERIEKLAQAHSDRLAPTACQGMIFTQDREGLTPVEAAEMIDKNGTRLHKGEAKYFEVEVCPSAAEQAKMFAGCTTERQKEKIFQDYVRQKVMEDYAGNFKGYKDHQDKTKEKHFTANDLVYFASIHQERRTNKEDLQWHAHVVVSRQTKGQEYKISPKAANRKENGKGPVKAAFDRTQFYNSCEQTFDKHFSYQRPKEETFTYKLEQKQQREQEREEASREMGDTKLSGDEIEIRLAELSRFEAQKKHIEEEQKRRRAEEIARYEAYKRCQQTEYEKKQEAERKEIEAKKLHSIQIEGHTYKGSSNAIYPRNLGSNKMSIDLIDENNERVRLYVNADAGKWNTMPKEEKAKLIYEAYKEQISNEQRYSRDRGLSI